MVVSSGPQAIDFKAVFEASPNPYLLLDRDLTIIGMNKAFLRATMTRCRAILGRNVFAVFPSHPNRPERGDLLKARRSFERVLNERTSNAMAVMRYDLRRPDAEGGALEERYWSAINTPILGKGGEVSAILQHFIDATELVRLARRASGGTKGPAGQDQPNGLDTLLFAHAVHEANIALDAERRCLRQLFMQAPGYIRIHRGPDHVVELSNPAASEMFGVRDVLGKPLKDAYPELVEQGYLELLDRVLATGEPYVGREARVFLRRRPGAPVEERYADFVYQPIIEDDGAISGVFVQGSDVTEHRRAKDELRRHQDHLEDLVRERTRALEESQEEFRHAQAALERSQRLEVVGQLTGGLAHDFNNLLTVVIGNLELIGGLVHGDPRLRSLTEHAQQAAERGERLTKQLLAFGRRQALRPEIRDINRLIDDAMPLVERATGERIEIEMRLADRLWPCRVDPAQFEATLLNVVLNARDAIAEHGKIVIETDNVEVGEPDRWPDPELVKGPYVKLQICDTGHGMDPQVAERAFEPFFTTKDVGQGSGLGLSQVYGFVRQSQGGVWLTSTLGVGTTVTVLLPRAEAGEAPPVEQPKARANVRAARPSGTILLVEDDEAVREVTREGLETLGYRVIAAASGREALQKLQTNEERIDLLFTDIMMPKGMSGIDLAYRAREIRPGLKVVLTSGHAGGRVAADSIVNNGFRFVAKPFRQAELAKVLRQALGASTQL